ncbi:MAG: periplasmic protein TonB [Acidobacteriota bacterium]|jgi:TonB family protein
MKVAALVMVFGCTVGLAATAAGRQDGAPAGKHESKVTAPRIVKEVKPEYTAEAKAANIQGTVGLDVEIQDTGHVGDVRVARSLDTVHGLDEQAVKAVKQWEFQPATKDGKAVPVRVDIEMTFTLK